jgi:hypothetical protein
MDDLGAAGDGGGDTNGNGNRNGNGDVDAGLDAELEELLDGERLGTLMIQQLGDLIDSWTQVLEAVAQHGVDPTPMLQTLAGTLRTTADMLDPPD